MKTAKELIKEIKPNVGNLSHIITTGEINGTLLIDVEQVMKEYAKQWVHETVALMAHNDGPPANVSFEIYNRIDSL